jgi:hypothetical protein
MLIYFFYVSQVDPTVIEGVAAREATAVASSGLVATSLQGDPTASTASPNANKRKKSCFNHRALNKGSGRSHPYNLRARSAKQIDTAFPAAVAKCNGIQPAPVITPGALDIDATAEVSTADVVQPAPEAALVEVAPRRYDLRPRSAKQLETAKAAKKEPKKTRATKKKAQPDPEPIATSVVEVVAEANEAVPAQASVPKVSHSRMACLGFLGSQPSSSSPMILKMSRPIRRVPSVP